MVHKESAHETHELLRMEKSYNPKLSRRFACLVGETMAHRILCFLIRVYSCVSWAEPPVARLVTWVRVLTHRGGGATQHARSGGESQPGIILNRR